MIRWFLILLISASAVMAEQAPLHERARAILNKNCVGCHGGERRFAGLDLTSPESMEDIVVPGKPEKSRLIELVVSGRMPANGEKLSRADIATLKAWIRAGAKL